MIEPQGDIVFVLHAHLPFVKEPEHEDFLEEHWLFEALTECYLPLLDLLWRLEEDGVSYGMALSLSPTLIAMLDDPLLRSRYEHYLARRQALLSKARDFLRPQHGFDGALGLYERRLESIRKRFVSLRGDVIGGFADIAKDGSLELITCALSHPVLPLLDEASQRTQINGALRFFEQRFGYASKGFWLPECAYSPGLERLLPGVKYTLLDSHALTKAAPRAVYGPFAAAMTPEKMTILARDIDTSRQIWSREEGYPGDPEYRDFYRDVGFDLPLEVIGDFLPPSANGPLRSPTGIKLHRITSRGAESKQPYQPARAMLRAEQHAAHFVQSRFQFAADLRNRLQREPLLVAPFDAELFGHWWFEGPVFLEKVLRLLHQENRLRALTPSAALERQTTMQVLRPPASSWGEGGLFQVWTDPESVSHLARCQQLSQRLQRAPHGAAREQAAIELALAQSSDWPFMRHNNTNVAYAKQRQQEHLNAATRCLQMAEVGVINEPFLQDRASRTPRWNLQ
jgi:1,4-alpha-glucan branching enzyme